VEKKRHDGKYEQNAGYDKWRTSEVKAEGCKMAMWNTYVVEVLAVIQYSVLVVRSGYPGSAVYKG